MQLAQNKTSFKTNVENPQTMAFGIGDASVVIEILRNRLYENKIQTMVQEYLCNARDANREANQSRSIEVTFPTKLSPVFEVRDFGNGITPDRMANVFVLYGASTKRHTNNMTGAFGIGAKSGWAYTDSFNVTTFVDGIKRVYIAHIGADQCGQVDLFLEEETSEPNGSLITINVKPNNIYEFQLAIIRATMFWSESEYPTFKQSADIKDSLDKSRKIGTSRFMDSNISGLNSKQYTSITTANTIVIDGVPYPMPNFGVEELTSLRHLAKADYLNIHIPNGLVQVSASREKIDDSEYSKSALKQVFSAAISDLKKAIKKWEDEIVDTKSMVEATKKLTGFKLSSNKEFDLSTIQDGSISIRTKFIGNDRIEYYFNIGSVSEDGRHNAFNPLAEHKYYLLKKSARTLKEIKEWISKNPNIAHIQLVTILAIVNEKKTVDGNDAWVPSVDENLRKSTAERLERLGFKNLADVIVREKKARAKVKIKGVIYDLSVRNEYKEDLEDILELKASKPWIYYTGRKSGSYYEEFLQLSSELKKFGKIEKSFRITESNVKYIKDDNRFIEYNKFIEDWEPSAKDIICEIASNKHNTQKIQAVLLNMCDKTTVLYKTLSTIINSQYSYSNYKLHGKIKKHKDYNKFNDAISNIETIIWKYFALLNDYTTDDDTREYVSWRIEKMKNDGVILNIPAELYS